MKFAILAFALVAASLCVMGQQNQLPAGAEQVVGTYETSFSCEGRKYGYYADMSSNCQVFHVCQPVTDENDAVTDTLTFSYFCGNQTTFNQEHLTCDHTENVDCTQAESYYSVNDNFGVVPLENNQQ